MNLPSSDILQQHLRLFFPSLNRFPDAYLPLVFRDTSNVPPHIAYVCPLCLNNYILFTNESVLASADFTMDHIPPQSVGGTFTMMTCKSCNNNSGIFESALLKKINQEAHNRGVTGIKIAATFKASNMRGHYNGFLIKDKAGTWLVDLDEKVLKKAPFLKQWLFADVSKGQWKGTLTVKHPDQKKVLQTLLKTAYLICFTHWGYDFVFSTTGELIRNVVFGEADYPLAEPYFWFDRTNLTEGISFPEGLCFIDKPAAFKAFTINIPLTLNGYNCIVPVLIPGPGEVGLKEIIGIGNYLKQFPALDISLRQILLELRGRPVNSYAAAWAKCYA